MSKFTYIHKLNHIINSCVSSEDIVQLRYLYNPISVKGLVTDVDHLTLEQLREMGYHNIEIQKHVPLSQHNLELICYQFEISGFKPDITQLCNDISSTCRGLGYCRAIIQFNSATIGASCTFEREFKDLNYLYGEFNRVSRDIMYANQIVSYMAQ